MHSYKKKSYTQMKGDICKTNKYMASTCHIKQEQLITRVVHLFLYHHLYTLCYDICGFITKLQYVIEDRIFSIPIL